MMFLASVTQFAALLAEVADNEQIDTSKISPGVGGFTVIALLAVALFFLGFDLVRRLRRAKYRAEIQEKLAAEIAERDAASSAATSDTAADSPSEGEPETGSADPRPGEHN